MSRCSRKAEKKRFIRAENERLLSRGAIIRNALPRLFHDFPPPPLPSSRGRSTNPGSSVIPRALSGSRTCPRVAIPLFGLCRTHWICRRSSEVSLHRCTDSRYVSALRYIYTGYLTSPRSLRGLGGFTLKNFNYCF